MKTQIKGKYILIAIAGILILMVSCNKDDNNQPTPEEKNIQFLKSALGGCNGSKTIADGYEKADTVILNLSNDTLNIFAGINYICCAPFITHCEITNDSILISITDTCPNPYHECYCRCYCYYTFEYYFEGIGTTHYYWQIILNDPREEEPIMFNSGELGIVKTEN
ncbi:MAG: hypothetical protein JXR61_09390 [Prolixibacteraceae bacterium]|nr:hypothetical protein [Prolixibacteraceae bacterium]